MNDVVLPPLVLPLVRPFVPRQRPLERATLFQRLPSEVRAYLHAASDAHAAGHSPWRNDLLFYGRRFALMRIPPNGDGSGGGVFQFLITQPGRAAIASWGTDRRVTDCEDEAIAITAEADAEWVRLAGVTARLKAASSMLGLEVQRLLDELVGAAQLAGGELLRSLPLTWSKSGEDLELGMAEATIALHGHHLRLRCEISPRRPRPMWVVESVYVPIDQAQLADPLLVLRQITRMTPRSGEN